mgnify:CR=1 FL=1
MKRTLILILFVLLPFASAFGEVGVTAQVDTSEKIYAGDRFAYHIILEGVREPGKVDVSPLSEFFPKLVGSRDYTKSSVVIINGKRKEEINKRYVMTYSLTAIKSGEIRIPGVEVTVDGEVYKTRPITVVTSEPQKSQRLDLELSVSPKKCYVGEPIEVEIKWFVHQKVAGAVAVEGVSVFLDVLDDDRFYVEKLVDSKSINKRQKYVGLQLNGEKVPFAQRGVTHKGTDWVELSYPVVLIPKRAGKVTIEPAKVWADLAVGRTIRRSFFDTRRETLRYLSESEGAELQIVPLPDVEKPDGAYGLVGNYTVSASATPKKVDVGQPIELTIKVGGSRYLSPVKWPDLENTPGFAGNFKISPQLEDPVVKDGVKIFKTTVRARNDEVTEIPPIELVYFDTDKGEYITASSDPIPLEVTPSEVVTIADAMMGGDNNFSSQVEAVKKGMSANFEDIELVSQDFAVTGAIVRPVYLALWAVPLGAFIFSVIVRSLTSTSEAKRAAARRRKAKRKSLGMLGKVDSGSKNASQAVVEAMREYVGDRFNRQAGSLTGMDCERVIAEGTADSETGREYRKIFEDCEASYYTGSGGKVDESKIKRIKELIKEIDRKS